MSRHRVEFRPEALEDLERLYEFIATNSTPDIAAAFTETIVSACESLATFPNRGRSRDDIRRGLRMISHRKRTVIAYAVRDQTVIVLGIYHGGRDVTRHLPDVDLDDQ